MKKYYGSIKKEIGGRITRDESMYSEHNFISPEMLQEYESVCEGSASVIANIIIKEQNHQHKKELWSGALSAASHLLSQLFAVALIFAVVILSVYLTTSGYLLSSFVIIISCAVIVCSISAVHVVRDVIAFKSAQKRDKSHNTTGKNNNYMSDKKAKIRSNAAHWKRRRNNRSR